MSELTPVSTAVKAAAEKVEAVVEKVEGVVVAEAKKVEGEVKAEAAKLRLDISSEEKLIVTRLENMFLKASLEIQRAQQIITQAQQQLPLVVAEFAKKYNINQLEMDFNMAEQAFIKK